MVWYQSMKSLEESAAAQARERQTREDLVRHDLVGEDRASGSPSHAPQEIFVGVSFRYWTRSSGNVEG
jgi:hypothetical protein